MKRYSTSIDFKFWIHKRIAAKVIPAVSIALLIVSTSYAQNMRFTPNERTIINSVIDRFKRECGHVAVVDESKLKEIQSFYQEKKDTMAEEHRGCYGEFLSQLVGTHNIHRQTCDEITPKKSYGKDKDVARIFVNVRRYETGIRSYHEKLNECLQRKGAPAKEIIGFSDFEKNGRALSKKVREVNLQMPFKENSVNYR